MMKKWILSHNGEMTAQLTEAEAIAFLQHTPDCYAWHPSFTQWQPASLVANFSQKVPAATPLERVPAELISNFNAKMQSLETRIASLRASVVAEKSALTELENEISLYKRLTKKLNDEVKLGIVGIESDYHDYQRRNQALQDDIELAARQIMQTGEAFFQSLENDPRGALQTSVSAVALTQKQAGGYGRSDMETSLLQSVAEVGQPAEAEPGLQELLSSPSAELAVEGESRLFKALDEEGIAPSSLAVDMNLSAADDALPLDAKAREVTLTDFPGIDFSGTDEADKAEAEGSEFELPGALPKDTALETEPLRPLNLAVKGGIPSMQTGQQPGFESLLSVEPGGFDEAGLDVSSFDEAGFDVSGFDETGFGLEDPDDIDATGMTIEEALCALKSTAPATGTHELEADMPQTDNAAADYELVLLEPELPFAREPAPLSDEEVLKAKESISLDFAALEAELLASLESADFKGNRHGLELEPLLENAPLDGELPALEFDNPSPNKPLEDALLAALEQASIARSRAPAPKQLADGMAMEAMTLTPGMSAASVKGSVSTTRSHQGDPLASRLQKGDGSSLTGSDIDSFFGELDSQIQVSSQTQAFSLQAALRHEPVIKHEDASPDPKAQARRQLAEPGIQADHDNQSERLDQAGVSADGSLAKDARLSHGLGLPSVSKLIKNLLSGGKESQPKALSLPESAECDAATGLEADPESPTGLKQEASLQDAALASAAATDKADVDKGYSQARMRRRRRRV